MTEKRFILEDEVIIDNDSVAYDGGRELYWTFEYIQRQRLVELMNSLNDENEQLKQFIQELTTKGTAKIHLANGSIYKVDAILSDFKGDMND